MELLLVHREPHPLDELAGGVHDLLLELRAGYGTGAGGVPEHDPVVLGEGSLGDVSAARSFLQVVRHGRRDLAALLEEPHVPVLRPAYRVHPPGLRVDRDVRRLAELLVTGFSVGRRGHRAPPSRRRRISSRPPPRRLLRRAGTKTPAPFARSSRDPRPGLCASPPRSPTG